MWNQTSGNSLYCCENPSGKQFTRRCFTGGFWVVLYSPPTPQMSIIPSFRIPSLNDLYISDLLLTLYFSRFLHDFVFYQAPSHFPPCLPSLLNPSFLYCSPIRLSYHKCFPFLSHKDILPLPLTDPFKLSSISRHSLNTKFKAMTNV